MHESITKMAANLNDVPKEILRLIFPYLAAEHNAEAIKALMLTCKRFLHLISEDPQLSTYAPLLFQTRKLHLDRKNLFKEYSKMVQGEEKKLAEINEKLTATRKILIRHQKGATYDDLFPLLEAISGMPDGNYFKTTGYIKSSKTRHLLVAAFGLLLFVALLALIVNIATTQHQMENITTEKEQARSDYINSPFYAGRSEEPIFMNCSNDDQALNKLCNNIKSDTCTQLFVKIRKDCVNSFLKWELLEGQSNSLKDLLTTLQGLTALPSALLLFLIIIQIVNINKSRSEIANTNCYTELPVGYLVQDHAKRWSAIKKKYPNEIAGENITKISDILLCLEKLYYQQAPNPHGLLVECNQYQHTIKKYLSTKTVYEKTKFFNELPRSKFYQKIDNLLNAVDKMSNEVKKDSFIVPMEIDSEESEDSLLIKK